MSYQIINMPVSRSKYRIKCPYSMTASTITIHNTANDAPAKGEASYMRSNSRYTSFHTVIDDKYVVRCIPYDRNAWHAGDGSRGRGNRTSIGIEICYSKSGGRRFTEAETNAAKYVAMLLKERHWGVNHLRQHHDWTGKNCPHRTRKHWSSFVHLIEKYMGGSTMPDHPVKPGTTIHPSPTKYDITYQAYTGKKWHNQITNAGKTNTYNGYAGVLGSALTGLKVWYPGKEDIQIRYRVHKRGGRWFYWRTDLEKDGAGDRYAGNLKNSLDMIQMTLVGAPGYQVQYRVYARDRWWSWITGYNNKNTNGYAGLKGYSIQAIQVRIVRK